MKILFYLPVVTPWWFDHIVEPILRRVAGVAEVHVLAPAPWRNTGLDSEALSRLDDLHIPWSIVDSDDHPSLRTTPADPRGLLDYVCQLAPDIVLCRSADFETARSFPGVVRFLMETAAAPFIVDPSTTTITDQPFGNGAVPILGTAERHQLEALIEPLWRETQAHWSKAIPDRSKVFAKAGIAEDRPVLLLPLEYEHEENFFVQYRLAPLSNAQLLTSIAERVTPHCSLVVTDHPLNALHVGGEAVREAAAAFGTGVILADTNILGHPATHALAGHVDGVLLGDSKCFSLAAFFGVPMLRQSRFATAPWLNAETDLDRFVAAICAGDARAPSAAEARIWSAYHLANEAFFPEDDQLTGEAIIDRALRATNADRWEPAIGRVQPVKPECVA